MTTFECSDKKLALNLNPYQIFVFVNEKTKPYLDQIKTDHLERYRIELIEFDAEKDSQPVVGEDVDPHLYYNITHSDLLARVMPCKEGDFRYASEILFLEKDYSGHAFYDKVNSFVNYLRIQESKSFVNTLRRYFQYGNEEFYDFLNDVYKGDLSNILEMSNYFTHIDDTSKMIAAQCFIREFRCNLPIDRQEQLLSLVMDTLGYASVKDSLFLLKNYLKYTFTPGSGGFCNLTMVTKANNEHLEPDFSLVVKYNKREGLMDTVGDYAIILKKDDGNQIELIFVYTGDKMLYLLTLLCQKFRGGLPTAYFTNEKAKEVLVEVFNKVYRIGGNTWVEKCSNNTHNISTYRSHAMAVIKNDERLEPYMAYWCNFENQTISVGKKGNKSLEVRKIRLPEDRIEIHEEGDITPPFSEILDKLPHLKDLKDFNRNKHTKLKEKQESILGLDPREETSYIPFGFI